eukprot:1825650-Pyramimonas_sp.AAC.1
MRHTSCRVNISCANIMLSCSNMPCQPALDGHAIDLGNRSGLKQPVWGYCAPATIPYLGSA